MNEIKDRIISYSHEKKCPYSKHMMIEMRQSQYSLSTIINSRLGLFLFENIIMVYSLCYSC